MVSGTPHRVPDTTPEEVPDTTRRGPLGGPRRGRRPKARRQEVIEALEQSGGDRPAAARALGVSVRTFYRYLNTYDLHDA